MAESGVTLETYSTREAAGMLGISVRTAQLWVEDGRLKAWKTPGGHRRILRESVEQMLSEQQGVTEWAAQTFDILLVEDDPIQRRLLETKLAETVKGARIRAAHDGYGGLFRIGELQPNLLIADLMMPGMDGFRMLRALTSGMLPKPMQIIVVTAMSDVEIAANGGLPAGVVVLHKPLPMGALTSLVEAFHNAWSQGRMKA